MLSPYCIFADHLRDERGIVSYGVWLSAGGDSVRNPFPYRIHSVPQSEHISIEPLVRFVILASSQS